MNKPKPGSLPKLLPLLLTCFLPEEDRSAVLGDFEGLWKREEGQPSLLRHLRLWSNATGVGLGFTAFRFRGRLESIRQWASGFLTAFPGTQPDGASLMYGWKNDLRSAARGLGKHPIFTCTAVLTLGTGIGATTSVFSTADALLFKPLPFPEPKELFYVPLVAPEFDGRPELEMEWSYPKYRLLTEYAEVFEGSTTYQLGSRVLTGDGVPEEIPAESVGPGCFALLGVPVVEGRDFRMEEDQDGNQPFVAILSHGLWVGRFGRDSSVLGQAIHLRDRQERWKKNPPFPLSRQQKSESE